MESLQTISTSPHPIPPQPFPPQPVWKMRHLEGELDTVRYNVRRFSIVCSGPLAGYSGPRHLRRPWKFHWRQCDIVHPSSYQRGRQSGHQLRCNRRYLGIQPIESHRQIWRGVPVPGPIKRLNRPNLPGRCWHCVANICTEPLAAELGRSQQYYGQVHLFLPYRYLGY